VPSALPKKKKTFAKKKLSIPLFWGKREGTTTALHAGKKVFRGGPISQRRGEFSRIGGTPKKLSHRGGKKYPSIEESSREPLRFQRPYTITIVKGAEVILL